MESSEARELLLTNYLIVLARFVLVIFIGVLSFTAGVLMLFMGEKGNSWIAAAFFLLPMLTLWFPLRAPVSILLGDDLSVRYVLGKWHYPISEISGIAFGEVRTGPGGLILQILRSFNVTATAVMKNGKKFEILVDRKRVVELQRLLQLRGLTWWVSSDLQVS